MERKNENFELNDKENTEKKNIELNNKENIEKENIELNNKENIELNNKETLADKVKKRLDPKTQKIRDLQKQLEECKNNYLRTLAEFDNFRKRNIKELSEARTKAINSFVLDLLPSIDNFEMSLKMTDNKEMFIKGVKMIHQNLLNTLKEHKIEEFTAKIGEEFDPIKHDPILIEDDSAKPGQVLGIVKKGYLQKDYILRPVKVQIAKQKNKK